ncbi:MAG: hypothetical protein JOZ54_04165 [Acidobacteria bacterium]|nr:hypothetical protein [Acidobacteriota bacterium]
MLAELQFARYRVVVDADGLPEIYEAYREHAELAEELDLLSPEKASCFFGVGTGEGWPTLVVAQSYSPSGSGFAPGILIVPETATVLIGAGDRLLAYSLESSPTRVWTDVADLGFWGWSRYGDVVLMSAELELAAWTTRGVKLWTTFVEPPWGFRVEGDRVLLDVMGRTMTFGIAEGPGAR